MRILHVTQSDGAGVGRHVAALASFQAARGASVAVAGPIIEGLSPAVEPLAWTARTSAVVRPSEWTELSRSIRAVDPDVVHLHSAKAGLVGRLILRGRRPTIFTPHAWSFLREGRTQAGAKAWERFAARWTTVLVAVSADEAAEGDDFGWSTPPVVVPNGVDLSRWQPVGHDERRRARTALGLDVDAPTALCVGRLFPQKGQLDLARRWHEVRASVPGAVLALVGDGVDRAPLDELRAPGVVLAGWAGTGEVDRWYAAADLVVQPSRWEGLSYVTLEAMASGLPVVAYAVGGMSQALGDGDHLVAPGDHGALVAKVVVLLQSPVRRADLGGRNRERAVAAFDEKPLLEEIDRVVHSLAR